LTNALGQLGLSQLLGGVLDGVLGALGGESAGLSAHHLFHGRKAEVGAVFLGGGSFI